MRFSAIAPAAVLYAASLVSAVCWRANTCPDFHFESKGAMEAFAVDYCADNWYKAAAHETDGYASASHQGEFEAEARCNIAFSSIIKCYGSYNGGYEESRGGRLVVSFGNCEVV